MSLNSNLPLAKKRSWTQEDGSHDIGRQCDGGKRLVTEMRQNLADQIGMDGYMLLDEINRLEDSIDHPLEAHDFRKAVLEAACRLIARDAEKSRIILRFARMEARSKGEKPYVTCPFEGDEEAMCNACRRCTKKVCL